MLLAGIKASLRELGSLFLSSRHLRPRPLFFLLQEFVFISKSCVYYVYFFILMIGNTKVNINVSTIPLVDEETCN